MPIIVFVLLLGGVCAVVAGVVLLMATMYVTYRLVRAERPVRSRVKTWKPEAVTQYLSEVHRDTGNTEHPEFSDHGRGVASGVVYVADEPVVVPDLSMYVPEPRCRPASAQVMSEVLEMGDDAPLHVFCAFVDEDETEPPIPANLPVTLRMLAPDTGFEQ